MRGMWQIADEMVSKVQAGHVKTFTQMDETLNGIISDGYLTPKESYIIWHHMLVRLGQEKVSLTGAEEFEQRFGQQKMVELLRQLEWSYPSTSGAACPSCHDTNAKGHAHGCPLDYVLMAFNILEMAKGRKPCG